MSFIYNWGNSWWPMGCCIPADVCGLEYRMPACTMSQRFLHQLPTLKWEEISHTHTHICIHFPLVFRKKKEIYERWYHILTWQLLAGVELELDLLPCISYFTGPILSTEGSQHNLPLSPYCFYLLVCPIWYLMCPLKHLKKKFPVVYDIHTTTKIWIGLQDITYMVFIK